MLRRRRRRVRFEASGEVTRNRDTFVLPTPTSELVLRHQGGSPPRGWIALQYRLRIDGLATFTPYLRVRRGNGGSTRIDLQPSRRGIGNDIVLLPDDTQQLRLGFGRAVRLNASACSITELGELWLLGHGIRNATAKSLASPSGARTEIQRMRLSGDDLQTAKHTLLNLSQGQLDRSYANWIEQYDTRTNADRAAMADVAARWTNPPQIVVNVDATAASAQALGETLASLMAQTYPNWRAAVLGTDPANEPVLIRAKAVDNRIMAPADVMLTEASHTSFVVAGDRIADHGLFALAADAVEHPGTALHYTDDDRIDPNGTRHSPNMKPEWDPVFGATNDYATRLSLWSHDGAVVSSTAPISWGSLADRALELDGPIRHVPFVAYHRSATELPNTRLEPPKPVAGTGEAPRVSAVICTRDRPELLTTCLRGLLDETAYPDLEVVIVDNGTTDVAALAELDQRRTDHRVRVLNDDSPFNYSALNNRGVAETSGELLLLLNNDIEITEPHWLRHMAELAHQPEVGAVGCRLDYPDGSLQHAGVIVGMGGVAGHASKHLPAGGVDASGRLDAVRQVSAVTAAAMMLRREIFDRAGRLDETDLTVAFNDIDLCIRIRRLGLRILFTPHARLIHHESVSRGRDSSIAAAARFASEIDVMRNRWSEVLDSEDPFHSPNLANDREDGSLAFPPRVSQPWDS